MTLDDLLGRLQGVRQSGDGFTALCPVHDDSNASLSLSRKNGKLLVHCFAGCETQDVMAALGLSMDDLFEESRKASTEPPWQKPVEAEYDYLNADGELLYQVVRHPNKPDGSKDFSQRRPSGSGWTWNLRGVRRVLYRLPRVLEAVQSGDTVFVVEGEKDVHSLEALGLTATCNSGGAGKWQDVHAQALEGAHAVILPDNDEAGRRHARGVASSVYGRASSVKVIELPDLLLKGDVTDWLAAGHSREELLALVDEAPEWSPDPQDGISREISGAAPDGFAMTDLGLAERFTARHGADLRFDVDSQTWLLWTGKNWRTDSTGEVHRLARQVVRDLYGLLPDCDTTEQKDALFGFVKRSESQPRLEAMLKLARYCEGIPVQTADLDADGMLFNCLNGTLDLRTGELREHRQADMLTKLSPVSFDPAAKADRWLRFLAEVFDDDAELMDFAKRMSGYMLTGDTREQAFFILQGKGSNGKGVFMNALRHVIGDYAKDSPVSTFTDRRGESTLCDLAMLAGARLVTASEGEDRTSLNESLVKRLTGGDPITCRHLYAKHFTYMPTFKIILATNEVPRIRSQNYSMKRRVKLLPFRVRFHYAHERLVPVRDEGLSDKLRAEAPGILAWMLEGCLDWQKRGLSMPDSMQSEVDSLFESMDVLLDFIEDECLLHPRLEVESGRLWTAYLAWCESNKTKPAFKRASDFSRTLCGRDSIEAKRTKAARLLVGIGLRGDGDSPPEEPETGINRMTADDAKTHFPETLFASDLQEDFSENAISRHLASPPRSEDTDSASDRSGESLPQTPCEECGVTDWRYEPFAFGGAGGFVCRKCFQAIEVSCT